MTPAPGAAAPAPGDVLDVHMAEIRPELVGRQPRLDVALDRHVARVVEHRRAVGWEAVDERTRLRGRRGDRARRRFDEQSDSVRSGDAGRACEPIAGLLSPTGAI